MHSSHKCNRLIEEDLVRCSETESLARAVVKAVLDQLDGLIGEEGEVRFFRKILSDQAIGVFAGASLPSRVGIGSYLVSLLRGKLSIFH